MPLLIKDFFIQDCGIDSPDYFNGVGIACTRWSHVSVGCGDTPREAAADAVEDLMQAGWGYSARVDALGSTLPAESPGLERIRREYPDSDATHYVAIFVK
jgi:hypothetical protein